MIMKKVRNKIKTEKKKNQVSWLKKEKKKEKWR
jgi:hypothetical protein